jgi:hypothetical protein
MRHGTSQSVRRVKLPAAGTLRAHEVGVAELANGLGSILLPTRPQVATGKAAKDGCTPRLAAFSLQGVVDLFD